MAAQSESWLETSDVVPMFATLVWQLQLRDAVRASIEARLLPLIAQLRGGAAPLQRGQGWQSAPTLHRRDELRELLGCCEKAVRSVLRFLQIGADAFEFTGCWLNVLGPGAAHPMHSHPNNYLSGVYYLKTQPGTDTINFHDPRPQAAVVRPPVTALTAANTDQVVVRVRNGTLLVFPSFLQHSVDANASAQERISVSFNVMFSSFAETLAQPLWGGAGER
jgi:uncharacterized protein (TIGR02466 family)